MDVPALLDSLEIKPAELARRVGVSDGHIWDLKSRRRRLTLKLAKKIEDATGVDGFIDAAIKAELAA
ncbi:hypothetical protein [Paraburkholderia fungorum]|uniref:hypothetical protein n=1 Tax=Paraburkholderia fungorum TaxID=134537 RepID=UPI003D6C5409